jgi:hypothetical protein
MLAQDPVPFLPFKYLTERNSIDSINQRLKLCERLNSMQRADFSSPRIRRSYADSMTAQVFSSFQQSITRADDLSFKKKKKREEKRKEGRKYVVSNDFGCSLLSLLSLKMEKRRSNERERENSAFYAALEILIRTSTFFAGSGASLATHMDTAQSLSSFGATAA